MKRVLGLTCCLLGLTGCGPRAVNNFGVEANPGFFSTDLICTNKSGEQLADVDLSVTAYFERGTSTGEGHYRKWLPNESKTLSVSSAGGSLQRIQLKGKARAAVKGDALLIQMESVMVSKGQAP
jgi:hypothetical protein